MKNTDDPSLQELADLFYKKWKGPVIVGNHSVVNEDYRGWYMEEVFPIREELLVLFKHWYEVYREEQYWLMDLEGSYTSVHRHNDASRRLDVIKKFLPEEEVDAVIKQVCEEERKRLASYEEKSHEEEQAPQRTT